MPAFCAVTASPPAEANPLAPIWTGAYVGLHGEISRAEIETQNVSSIEETKPAFGGHLGYNLELGSWMLGIEADASSAGSSLGLSIAGGGTALFEADWQGSLRGRVGLAVGPVLLYATAGWSWTAASLIETTAGGSSRKLDATYDGVVYGIGAEAYVLPSISLRLEALRYDYGAEKLSLADGAQALRDIELDDTRIRAGVTIHFR